MGFAICKADWVETADDENICARLCYGSKNACGNFFSFITFGGCCGYFHCSRICQRFWIKEKPLTTPIQKLQGFLMHKEFRHAKKLISDGLDISKILIGYVDPFASDKENIVWLIDNGADIHAKSEKKENSGITPIFKSFISIRFSPLMKELIERGVDVNVINDAGDTALMDAIKCGHICKTRINSFVELAGAKISWRIPNNTLKDLIEACDKYNIDERYPETAKGRNETKAYLLELQSQKSFTLDDGTRV